jgi:hypothetical protein
MKTWFYFYVSGAHKNQTISFSIKNMNRQFKLLSMGLRPVFKVIPGTKNWQKVCGSTRWNKGDNGLELHFEHTFTM